MRTQFIILIYIVSFLVTLFTSISYANAPWAYDASSSAVVGTRQ